MSETKGIQDTTELLRFALHVSKAVADSLSNGVVEKSDAIHFWKPLTEIWPAFDGVQNVPGELGDLNGEELDLIKAELIKEFPLDVEGVDKVIQIAFDVGHNIQELVQWFKTKK